MNMYGCGTIVKFLGIILGKMIFANLIFQKTNLLKK